MRVAIATLGCKVNQYDTAVMQRLFDERGWSRVDFNDPADAYVVNSCTVTDRADADARRMARRARRRNPDSRVIMTGCYAQTSPGAVAGLEYVDYVIGLGRLPELLSAVEGELDTPVSVADLRRESEVRTLGIESFPGRTRAFVKVQEGCNLFCTFCIIPVARGRSRSVPPRTVVEEVLRLEGRGYREVVLTGIHLGGYGDDLEPACDLAFLLEAIAERRPGLRVRISSVDPPELTPRLIDLLCEDNGIFCPHLHVPIQAASDPVLERMGRKYCADEAESALVSVRERLPDVSLGTDLITGFPGETESEFEEGLARIRRIGFHYLHVFPYSRRSSTAAAKRWEELPDHQVHERARVARRVDRDLRRAFEDRFAATTRTALFEDGRDPQSGLLKGYTDNYLPVACEGDDSLAGRLVPVRIGECDGAPQRVGKRLLTTTGAARAGHAHASPQSGAESILRP